MPSAFTTRLFATVDAGDAVGFGRLFTPTGGMVFGNGDPMVGPEAIAAGVQGFFDGIRSLRHEVLAEWIVDADTIATARVTYTRLDGREVTVPTASIWHVDDSGLIEDYQIYFDVSPVFA